jgi:hypothetical protein
VDNNSIDKQYTLDIQLMHRGTPDEPENSSQKNKLHPIIIKEDDMPLSKKIQERDEAERQVIGWLSIALWMVGIVSIMLIVGWLNSGLPVSMW